MSACRLKRIGCETRRGFTLTEVIAASFLTLIIIASAYSAFIGQQQFYLRQSSANEMQYVLSTTADMIVRDVRMSGYGLGDDDTVIADWVDWVPGVSNAITVTEGASGAPDALSLVGAFMPPVGALSNAVAAGATTLIFRGTAPPALDTSKRKLIFVGRNELARVVNVSSNIVTVSAHPTLNSVGLKFDYPAGAPVDRIDVVAYSCEPASGSFPRQPFMSRDLNDGILTNALQQMLGLGIEDFQVSTDTDSVTFYIRTKSSRPDTKYTYPATGDSFRRIEMSTRAATRNAL